MTGGPHIVATAGTERTTRAGWVVCGAGLWHAAGERAEQGSRGGAGRLAIAGCAGEAGQAERMQTAARKKMRGRLRTNEFKCKFEFKHFKTMHQQVCNIKLL
jgi:hypothetical protein